jgi:methionyl-tRNA formyltransferase
MRVTAGLDSGPIAISEEIAIQPEDDFESLSGRLERLGTELLVEGLDRAEAGDLRFTDQDEEGATYAEKIDPSERRLDPGRPAAELARTVRALTPHIGAYLEAADGTRLGVRRARPIDARVARGTIRAEWGALLLGCGQGTLRLEVVQPAGGRPMPAEAFLRGHQIPNL